MISAGEVGIRLWMGLVSHPESLTRPPLEGRNSKHIDPPIDDFLSKADTGEGGLIVLKETSVKT